MPIDTKELFDAIAILADERNMRITLKQSTKGALICAGSSFLGGMLLGPVGLALGGAAGGVAAYKMTNGSFKPVGEIIRYDLSSVERGILQEKIVNAVRRIEPVDAAMLLPLILNNTSIQQAVLNTVASFVTNELKLQIAN